jgi:hypothetical protein
MKASFKVVAVSLALFVSFSTLVSAASVNIADLKVDTTKVTSSKELVKQSDLIVYGRFDSPLKDYPTSHMVNEKKLVNYVQSFHARMALKGNTGALVRVLTTGVEPLPLPTDPLNKIYSGPIAEGEYVCFLKKVPGTNLYTLIGVWQGLYPVIDRKTMALEEFGFSEFGNLTVQELYQKIKSY